jgi:hypothetical protein
MVFYFVMAPDLMHCVHTIILTGFPSFLTLTFWRLGSQRRFFRLWAWLTRCPTVGPFPQISQRRDMRFLGLLDNILNKQWLKSELDYTKKYRKKQEFSAINNIQKWKFLCNEPPRRKQRGITRNWDHGRRKRRGTFGPSELSKALERRPLSSMINSGLLTARLNSTPGLSTPGCFNQ